MMFSYIFPFLCEAGRLQTEIAATSAIISELSHVEIGGNPVQTIVFFNTRLSPDETIWLNNVVDKHVKTIPDTVFLDPPEADVDGAQVVRLKAAKAGWSFWALPPEITTSTLGGSLYCKDSGGVDIAGISCKIYDASDDEITTAGLAGINLTACTKTVLDVELPFDVELIGGSLRIASNVSQDVRVWIVGAPDIPAGLGGSKEFASGINLRFLASNSSFEIDGRVTKYISFNSETHSGKIRVIFKHAAGVTLNLQMIFHLYRQ